MMDDFVIEEGNLKFDFTHCGKPIKFDTHNNSGLYAVDFFVDNEKYLLFIEVKDYQNPNTTHAQQKDDYNMLFYAGKSKESVFAIKMGSKIKDSLLSLYAKGDIFTKNVIYLLFINFDDLKAAERQLLFDKISGQIPTGLNNDLFTAFKKIQFKLVNAEMLKKKYGIICTNKVSIQK
jgi:hypothetical protein